MLWVAGGFRNNISWTLKMNVHFTHFILLFLLAVRLRHDSVSSSVVAAVVILVLLRYLTHVVFPLLSLVGCGWENFFFRSLKSKYINKVSRDIQWKAPNVDWILIFLGDLFVLLLPLRRYEEKFLVSYVVNVGTKWEKKSEKNFSLDMKIEDERIIGIANYRSIWDRIGQIQFE